MKTVFVDVDTQLDFLYPAGALYVPGAERIIPAVQRLNRYAAANGVPVLSTTDTHTEDDPEFRDWPPHCIAGTAGQHKPAATLLESRIVVPNREGAVSIAGAQQVILEKQTIDAFRTRSLRNVLEALQGDRFVIYGVVTEICVSAMARGLLAAGKAVTLVTGATQSLNTEKAAQAIEEIYSLGGVVSENWAGA
jgi:nicotinamidase/pyrazinamidase